MNRSILPVAALAVLAAACHDTTSPASDPLAPSDAVPAAAAAAPPPPRSGRAAL
jgi:hypothetical protein